MTATAAAPEAGVATLRDRVREARDRRQALRVTGAGTWLDAGRPVRDAAPLPVAGLRGVVDYVPGDFTITVRAGTPLDELARALAPERQWAALDPFGAPAGTVGATVATGSAGPLAHAFGLPRDNVLGLEVVTGRGELVRAGGRVVKNVAGFDLVRLFAGSWGTLGAITEVTLRTRALPEADETWTLPSPAGSGALDVLLRALRASPIEPWACELVSGPLARTLGVGDAATLLVRLAGNADSARAQRAALARLGAAERAGDEVWDRLRGAEPAGAAVVRRSDSPARLAALWEETERLAAPVAGAMLHAPVGRGIVRCILPVGDAGALARAAGEALRGRAIAERLPHIPWPSASAPPASAGGAEPDDEAARRERVRRQLMQRVKETFDPMHILNPGILGEAAA